MASSNSAARPALHLAWDSSMEAGSALGPRRLFEALDGRSLFVNDKEWHLRVYSVVDDSGTRWVQLGFESGGCLPITLKMSPKEGPKTIVHSLTRWLRDPSSSDRPADVL